MSQPVTGNDPQVCKTLQPNAIGIDIGGTKIYGALINTESPTGEQIGDLQHVPTPKASGAFLSALGDIITTLQKTCPVEAVGIATAGVVDAETGTVLGSTGNLPAISEVAQLGELIRQKTGLRVQVENDANAAAYGEFKAGAAHGSKSTIAITLGTGVGMGIVLDGRLYRGAHYFAAEGGHIALSNRKERLCTCGRWGCWEAYASGNGLRVSVREALLSAPDPVRADFLPEGKFFDAVTTYDLMDAFKKKNKLAIAVIDRWHEEIALGLGSLLNVLDPEVVVVGGGLAQFVDYDKLQRLTDARSMRDNPTIVQAKLGNLAGIVGAAHLALDSQDSVSG